MVQCGTAMGCQQIGRERQVLTKWHNEVYLSGLMLQCLVDWNGMIVRQAYRPLKRHIQYTQGGSPCVLYGALCADIRLTSDRAGCNGHHGATCIWREGKFL